MFIVTNNFYKEVFNIKRENKITLCNGRYTNHKKITPEGLKEWDQFQSIEPMYSIINTLRYHSNNHSMHHYNKYLFQILEHT